MAETAEQAGRRLGTTITALIDAGFAKLFKRNAQLESENAVLEKALELGIRRSLIYENPAHVKELVAKLIAEAEAELHPKGGQP